MITRSILLIFILFVNLSNASSQEIEWISWTSLEREMKDSPKPVFIFIHTDWCGWCKRMQETTFINPEVIRLLNANFYCVKFDAETKSKINFAGKVYTFNSEYSERKNGTHQLAIFLEGGYPVYPSSVFTDKNLNIISLTKGSSGSETFLNTMRPILKSQRK